MSYGNTGSGKTHTMFGQHLHHLKDQTSGIIPQVITKLFQNLPSEYKLSCSII
jgi:hypothetical protein